MIWLPFAELVILGAIVVACLVSLRPPRRFL